MLPLLLCLHAVLVTCSLLRRHTTPSLTIELNDEINEVVTNDLYTPRRRPLTWRSFLRRVSDNRLESIPLEPKYHQLVANLIFPLIYGTEHYQRYLIRKSRTSLIANRLLDNFTRFHQPLISISEEDVKIFDEAFKESQINPPSRFTFYISAKKAKRGLFDLSVDKLVLVLETYLLQLIDEITPLSILQYILGFSNEDPIRRLSKFSDKLVLYLAERILVLSGIPDEIEKYGTLIRRLAKSFYKRRNLQLLFCVNSVYHLDRFPELVEETSKKLKIYDNFFGYWQNFRGAREVMKVGIDYSFPLYAILSRDMIYIRDLPNEDESGDLNLHKFKLAIDFILVFFHPRPDIIAQLKSQTTQVIIHPVPISVCAYEELQQIEHIENSYSWSAEFGSRAKEIFKAKKNKSNYW